MDYFDLPRWVRKRDGRRVPFDADKISQALFAATEALGLPNAFLARELADGVLHFLAQETGENELTTTQIADLAVKVTRELGHPELARAFLQQPSPSVHKSPPSLLQGAREVARRARRRFEERVIYTRDLAAAMRERLLHGCVQGHPDTITQFVLEPRPRGPWGQGILEQMVARRNAVSETFILDSPEYGLSTQEAGPWLRQLGLLLQALRRTALLNLNCAEPPVWARPTPGPLFQHSAAPPNNTGTATARVILDSLAQRPAGWRRIVVDWHIQPHEAVGDLFPYIRQGVLGRCTFDRPGQPLSLAEGLERTQPAILMKIGMDLPRFLALPALDNRVDRFLEKLPSLVGMAVSAASQRRAYLTRRHSPDSFLAQAFLIHRSRLLLRPLGLATLVRQVLGKGLTAGKDAMDLARRILQALARGAEEHGRRRNLETSLIVRLGQPSDRLEGLSFLSEQMYSGGGKAALRIYPTSLKAELDWLALAGQLNQKKAGGRILFPLNSSMDKRKGVLSPPPN